MEEKFTEEVSEELENTEVEVYDDEFVPEKQLWHQCGLQCGSGFYRI